MKRLNKIVITTNEREERMMTVYWELIKMNKQYFPEQTEEELIETMLIGERS